MPGATARGIGRVGGAFLLCVACAREARADDWGLAPVRTWGSVAYDVRAEHVDDQPDRLQQLFTTTLNMSSYIWEPWFAVTSGGVGMTFSDVDASGTGGRDRFLTGNARLNLFPRSRFPFEAHFDATDSRIGGTDGGTAGYRSTEFGLVQRYRPTDSTAQLTASYDHRDQDSVRVGRYSQELLQLDFSQSLARHNVSFNSSLSDSRRLDAAESVRYHTFVARHDYSPTASLSIDTVANWSETASEVAAIESANRYLQLNSLAFWRDARRPLTVSASARLFDFQSSHGADVLGESRQVAANVGATYLLGRHWRFTGGGNFAATRTGEDESTAGGATLGASWQGEALTRGRFEYDRYASGDLSANHGGGAQVETDPLVAALQAGHGLTWTWTSPARARLALSFGQSGSWQNGVSSNAFAGSGPEATHTAAITWSEGDAQRSTYLRFSVGDTRSLGGRGTRELQLLNLQATRMQSSDSDSSWTGSLTLQASRQRNASESLVVQPRGFRATAAADLTYQRDRLFGVQQLRFASLLRVSQERELQIYPDLRDRESHSWENRLDWRAGKLATRVAVRVARVEDQLRYLATFKVIREIGD